MGWGGGWKTFCRSLFSATCSFETSTPCFYHVILSILDSMITHGSRTRTRSPTGCKKCKFYEFPTRVRHTLILLRENTLAKTLPNHFVKTFDLDFKFYVCVSATPTHSNQPLQYSRMVTKFSIFVDHLCIILYTLHWTLSVSTLEIIIIYMQS